MFVVWNEIGAFAVRAGEEKKLGKLGQTGGQTPAQSNVWYFQGEMQQRVLTQTACAPAAWTCGACLDW